MSGISHATTPTYGPVVHGSYGAPRVHGSYGVSAHGGHSPYGHGATYAPAYGVAGHAGHYNPILAARLAAEGMRTEERSHEAMMLHELDQHDFGILAGDVQKAPPKEERTWGDFFSSVGRTMKNAVVGVPRFFANAAKSMVCDAEGHFSLGRMLTSAAIVGGAVALTVATGGVAGPAVAAAAGWALTGMATVGAVASGAGVLKSAGTIASDYMTGDYEHAEMEGLHLGESAAGLALSAFAVGQSLKALKGANAMASAAAAEATAAEAAAATSVAAEAATVAPVASVAAEAATVASVTAPVATAAGATGKASVWASLFDKARWAGAARTVKTPQFWAGVSDKASKVSGYTKGIATKTLPTYLGKAQDAIMAQAATRAAQAKLLATTGATLSPFVGITDGPDLSPEERAYFHGSATGHEGVPGTTGAGLRPEQIYA